MLDLARLDDANTIKGEGAKTFSIGSENQTLILFG